jgi:hypothetical protein
MQQFKISVFINTNSIDRSSCCVTAYLVSPRKAFSKKGRTNPNDNQSKSYSKSNCIRLGLLDDILIINQHRVSEFNHTSVGHGRAFPRIGIGSSTSRTVGDVPITEHYGTKIIMEAVVEQQ